jgi:hypothetical protein
MYRGPDDFTHRSTKSNEVVVWGEMLGAAVPDNHAGMVRELMTNGGTSYDLEDHRQILAAYDRFLDRWGFRTAFPTADALFVSIGNKSYDFWGRVVETARLAEANDYFVMSGWESTAIENHSGLLDNLRGFKGNPELIGKRLAPLRVVIKPNSLVFANNDAPRVDFFVLNESGKPHGAQLSVRLETPTGGVHDLAAFRIPDLRRDRFVYPVAAGFRTPPLTQEGTYRIYALIEGMPDAGAKEEIQVVDPSPYDMLIRKAGIITQNPALLKPFEIVPGLTVEPFTWGKKYDLIIAANRFVVPPSAETEPERKIAGTEDEQLYRTIHYGAPENFGYLFSGLRAGKARVTLRFVEAFQNAPGVRVFDVAINGETTLKDFDVYTRAGGKDIACDTSFTVPLYDGCVEITVPRVSSGSARFAAIKIEAGDSVIAINCGGKPYRDRNGLLWKPYEPSVQLDDAVLDQVWNGAGLLVLAEGEVAAGQYAQRLADAGAWSFGGVVGEARASWMGSWYFVRDHPVYAGLPVDAGMGSYYQLPVANSCGVLLDGKRTEVFVGYSRDHDRNIGAGGATAPYGSGRILFHCVPGVVSGLIGTSVGMHPVFLRRLIANSLKYLQQGGN